MIPDPLSVAPAGGASGRFRRGLLRVALATALCSSAAASSGTDARPDAEAARYTVFLAGNRAGSQSVTAAPGGELRIRYEYADRGRGPSLDAAVAVGADGVPARIEITGHDYLKVPVEERFELAGGRAGWRNAAEQGERPFDRPAFYVPLDSPPEMVAILARALLRAPDGSLPLLPEGRARITRLGERRVARGGEVKALRQVEVGGLGFAPFPLWLEGDGSLFAWTSSWLSVVREGWEEALPELEAADRAAEQERLAGLARTLARRPAGPLAIRGARLFDPRSGTVSAGTTVIVRGERIAAVGPDGEVALPLGAEVIDAGGKTLLPGLWDMHTHLSDLDGILHLAAGVTAVRDLANDVDQLARLRRAWDQGTAIGPRVVAAGFLDGPGPYAGPTKVLVDNPGEARAAIDRYAELGYVQIKVYSSIRPELVPAIVERAHARGLRVSGHVPAFMTAEQAVAAGFDEIQHANMLFLNFWAAEVPDTRTPARFTAVAERAADLDLTSPEVRRLISLLAEKRIEVDPTLAVFEGMFNTRPGEMCAGDAKIAHRLPPLVRRGLLTGGLPVPAGMDQRYRDSYRAMVQMVGELWRAGVPIVAGTDALPGFALHRELELYAEAGIPPAEILRLATLGAAEVAGRADELGSIEPGKLADLVLVDGEPEARTADIRRVVLTVKGGTLHDPAALYRAVGVEPF